MINIKDDVVRFYVQNFIINKSQNIEVPGFVFFRVSGKTPIYARQVIMPESFFVNLEIKLRDKGSVAQKALYSAGKKFGYRFSLLGGFPSSSDKSGSALVDYISVINKFIEGTYASRVDCKVNVDEKSCLYTIENFVIINKLGFGYFLPLGAAAGMLSYIFNDNSIEGIISDEVSAPGRVQNLYYAPKEIILLKSKNFFSESDLSGLQPTQEYVSFNQVRRLNCSSFSFKKLLDSKFFNFNKGIILNNSQRYFIVEVSALYLIEKELAGFSNEIYDSAFSAGEMAFMQIDAPSLSTVSDYLAAFGWGDVLVLEREGKFRVNSNYFPYTKFCSAINFTIFKGIVAGMLSVLSKRKVEFSKVESSISKGYLSVNFFE
mgnify:CR=1 FL=1